MWKTILIWLTTPLLWLMAFPAVGLVGLQAILFSRRAMKSIKTTDMTKSEGYHAFRAGAISAIGPAIAVFIVMLGMMSVIGAPFTWLRLSFIGAAPTELTAAQMGAEAMGVEFGSAEYGTVAFATSVWAMTLNGCGWLLVCGLFTDKIEILREKVAGDDTVLLGVIGGAAMLGTMAYLTSGHLVAGGGRLYAAISAGLAMAGLVKLADRKPALKEYTLGIAMVIGMTVAVLMV